MQITVSSDLVGKLNDLFTRSYYSATGYVFESQPYVTDGDQDVLTSLRDARRQERSHARMLAQIIESLDRVPEPGAFPYWHRDLNYLTVPYLAGFVIGALEDDVVRYENALADLPANMGLARTMLQSIRAEKLAVLDELRPLAEEAQAREAKAYADEIAAVKKTRMDRLAKEKAAKEAARKAKSGASAAVAGMPDPDEPGISNKEKARRTVMRMRAIKSGAAAPAAADPAAGMPDPNEPGISNKEKAKRTMMIKRARAKGAAAAPAADPAAGLPDPNEPGISNKEKAKRTMMIKRARAKGAAAAPAAAPADPAAGMPDPDEPGISNKEKAKRTMMIKRARAKAAAAPAAAAPAEDADPAAGLPDPNEAGISNKEKAKRTMMIKRARAKKKD